MKYASTARYEAENKRYNYIESETAVIEAMIEDAVDLAISDGVFETSLVYPIDRDFLADEIAKKVTDWVESYGYAVKVVVEKEFMAARLEFNVKFQERI